MAETIKKVSKQSNAAINNPDLNQSQLKMIETKMAELEEHFKSLLSLVQKRQVLLEDSLSFFQLMQDLEEEGQWCDERLTVCQASITAKDLRGLTRLQQRHKAGEDEMLRRHNRFVSGSQATCEEMIASGHSLSDQLREKLKQVQAKWSVLKEEVEKKKQTLDAATEAFQFFSDCNETESIIKEFITLAKSKVTLF